LQISCVATLVSLVLGYVIALHLARNGRAPARAVHGPGDAAVLDQHPGEELCLHRGAGRSGAGQSGLGWLSAPLGAALHLEMLFNRVGVIIGMSNYLLPFMVFPILASLLAQNASLRRVAEIMGAGPVRIFLRITLPLSLPGVLAGVLMSMTLAMGCTSRPHCSAAGAT
jgi:mannopine transport system permease protein